MYSLYEQPPYEKYCNFWEQKNKKSINNLKIFILHHDICFSQLTTNYSNFIPIFQSFI